MNKSIITIETHKFGVYDFIISLLIITALSFYDIKLVFLGMQALSFVVTFLSLFKRQRIDTDALKFLIWALIFVVYSLSSLLWVSSTNTTALMCTFSVLQVALIAFCILVYCNTEKRKQNVIFAFIISSAVISCRFFVIIPFDAWGQMSRFSKDSIFGGNVPAMILSFSVIFLFHAFSNKRLLKLNNLFMVTLMILFSLITVLMGTRMGLIMIAFGIGFLYISKTPKILVFGKRLIVSIVVLAIVYYAIMNVDVLYGSIGYRVETMISGFLGNETDASTDDRSFFALEALSVFKEHVFIGIGQDGYRYVNSREFTYSHNNYVEILANLGIVGFVIFNSIFVWLLIRSWKSRKNSYLSFVLTTVLLLLGISQVFYSNEMAYIIMSIIIAISRQTDEQTSIIQSD